MLAAIKRYNPNTWLRQLYNWVMKWAEHPKSLHFLCFFAFIESIFFPIPIDPFLMAIASAKPRLALLYSFFASLFSVVGALGGYLLGFLFWEATKDFFLNYIFSQSALDIVLQQFHANAFSAMFLAGFTPIPFKVFTIAAGVANLELLPFVLASMLSRSLRFGIEGLLIYLWGPRIRSFIERYFEKITIAVGLAIVVGLVVLKNRS